MTVVDAHVHVYPEKIALRAAESVGDFYQYPMFKEGSIPAMLAAVEGSPITHHIIYSVATKPSNVESINDFIAAECKKHPNFVGFMAMHQDYPNPEAEIERAIGLGLRGMKLHPDTQKVNMDDDRLMRIYELIEGRMPLVMHCGDYRTDFSHPRRMKHILHEFPNLVVDAAHFCRVSGKRKLLPRHVELAEVSGASPHAGALRNLRRRPHPVRVRLPHVGPLRRVRIIRVARLPQS